MNIISSNPVPKRLRLEAFLADTMVVFLAYAFFTVFWMMVYLIVKLFKKITTTNLTIQLASLFLVGLPVWLLLAKVQDHFGNSLGKNLLSLELESKNKLTKALRWALMFVPYQMLYLGILNYFSAGKFQLTLIYLLGAALYWLILGIMVIVRPDQRHWIDLLTSSQVTHKELGDD